MAWFKAKSNSASPAIDINKLGQEMKRLDFSARWNALKDKLPYLDGKEARDLARLILTENSQELIQLTDNRRERELAIECLGYLPSRINIGALIKLLGHKDDAVQLMAGGSLQHHTPRLVVPLLIEGLKEGSIAVARAGEVLLSMGFLAQDIMLEVYPEVNPDLQAIFLELMVMDNNPKCRKYLGAALRGSHSGLKKKALEGVKHFEFRDLWPEVAECLDDGDRVIKAKALEVLAVLKIKEAREFAELCLTDQDPWVRQNAAICIQILAD